MKVRFSVHLDNNIYLPGVYVWPQGSTPYIVVGIDFCVIMIRSRNTLSNLDSVFATGDFNSRISLKNDLG